MQIAVLLSGTGSISKMELHQLWSWQLFPQPLVGTSTQEFVKVGADWSVGSKWLLLLAARHPAR